MDKTLRETVPLQLRKILKKSFGRLVGSIIAVIIGTAILYSIMGAEKRIGVPFSELIVENPKVWGIWFIAIVVIVLHRCFYRSGCLGFLSWSLRCSYCHTHG